MGLIKQEKIIILAKNFKKLDESQKESFQKLLRKLVDIHCNSRIKGIPYRNIGCHEP